MAMLERRLARLEKDFAPPRRTDRDPHDMTSEELAYLILEGLPSWKELVEAPESSTTRDIVKQWHSTRQPGLADDDPRLTDPVELYVSDLLRELLGGFHNMVRDPTLLLERYRGRFPDRVLASAYYAAWHHKPSVGGRLRESEGYSPEIRARMKQLAGIVQATEEKQWQLTSTAGSLESSSG